MTDIVNKLADKLAGCTGKEQYNSKAAAVRALNRINAKQGRAVHPYRCQYCRMFHLGAKK